MWWGAREGLKERTVSPASTDQGPSQVAEGRSCSDQPEDPWRMDPESAQVPELGKQLQRLKVQELGGQEHSRALRISRSSQHWRRMGAHRQQESRKGQSAFELALVQLLLALNSHRTNQLQHCCSDPRCQRRQN